MELIEHAFYFLTKAVPLVVAFALFCVMHNNATSSSS